MRQKLLLAATLVGGILIADIVTKQWALDALQHGMTHVGLGGLPLTLAFNQGIAFGLDIPSAGRWILIVASVFVVLMLAGMFKSAKPDDWVRLCALSLVAAGAVGNLIDRIRWDRGVVDFIGPINLGFMNWPISTWRTWPSPWAQRSWRIPCGVRVRRQRPARSNLRPDRPPLRRIPATECTDADGG